MTTLNANRDTVVEFRETKDMLVEELERIVQMTREYPVVCTFAGYRYIFECKQDVLDLIAEISGAVDRYDQAA